ncbi:MAG TPA: substrate-binding domain-containing protein, partial [Cellulomonas sp.]
MDALPKDVQQYYGSYQTFAKLFADPYKGWTPPPAPWKFCLNDSYLGNDWRQGDLAELQRQVKLYEAAGLAIGDLVVTNSDNQIALQLSQFSTLVNEGCNVIFSLPGSPTALCAAFTSAREKGVLVVTDESPTYCPDSINVSWNGYWAEYVGVKGVLDALGGKGNIV